MLEAELRGKTQGEFWESEDLLTSSVFGLLQYIPPNIFWQDLLREAILCNSISFIDKCNNFEIDINRYEKLEIHFWPVHSIFGEPDLILVFSGSNQLPLCFIIEAKIGASKSGEGEYDQLNRYLNALTDLTWLRKITGLRSDVISLGVIYLTKTAAWFEIHDSIENASSDLDAENRLFHLHWQDILDASRKVNVTLSEPSRMMLSKIALFLHHRGLEYFKGFGEPILDVDISSGIEFYQPVQSQFNGFSKLYVPEFIDNEINYYLKILCSFKGFTEERLEVNLMKNIAFYGGNSK